jgi:hypothetical protein
MPYQRPSLEQYGPHAAKILAEDRLFPLDAGRPTSDMIEPIARWPARNSLPSALVAREPALRSALFLYHDLLDESHTISQSLSDSTGSLLHGIMHRREGDFGNAKYWFRQAGEHPVFEQLTQLAQAERWEMGRFDPSNFVDRVALAGRRASPDEAICREIQRAEWWLLWEHLWHGA